jgi:hypothetical protein
MLALLNRTSKTTKNVLLLRLKRTAGLNDDGSMSPSSFASPELGDDFNPSQESLESVPQEQTELGDPDAEQNVDHRISNVPATPDHHSTLQLQHRLSDSPQIEMRFSNVSLSKQFPIDMLASSVFHGEGGSDTSAEENHTEQAHQSAATQEQSSLVIAHLLNPLSPH